MQVIYLHLTHFIVSCRVTVSSGMWCCTDQMLIPATYTTCGTYGLYIADLQLVDVDCPG